jgi:hypothetical protein
VELRGIGEQRQPQTTKKGLSEEGMGLGETEPAWKDALDYFARLSLTSLTGDPNLSPQERANVNICIAHNAKMESGWELGQLPLIAYDLVEFSAPLKPESEYTVRFYLGKSKGWRMQAGGFLQREPSDSTDSYQPLDTGVATIPVLPEGLTQRLLSHTTVAELVVFHDLWMLGPDGGRSRSPLLQKIPVDGLGWANVEWTQGHNSAILPWLAPQFQSFWEFDLFLSAWNKFVREVGTYDDIIKLQRAFFTWISAGAAVVGGRAMAPLPQTFQINWEELNQQLAGLCGVAADPLTSRSELARDWLVRVAAMLMPETGLSIYTTTPIANSNELKAFWEEQRQPITHLRAKRLGELARKQLPDLANKLRVAPTALGPNYVFEPSEDLVYKTAGITKPDLPSPADITSKAPAQPSKTQRPASKKKVPKSNGEESAT